MIWRNVPAGESFFEAGDAYFQLRTGAEIPQGFATGPHAARPVIVLPREGHEAVLTGQPGIRIPAFYTDPIVGLEQARWRTAFVDQEFFASLTSDPNLRSAIERIEVLPPLVPQRQGAGAAIGEDSKAPYPYERVGTVVMGIIDFGIAFAHERFRLSAQRSRVEYMWVQDAPSAPNPHPVPYGHEIRAANINHLLSTGRGGVDEDSLYRRAAGRLGQSWLRSVSRRAAHGTHVMDLACGYDLDEEERARRPIVCVQLPEATTADTSGDSLDTYALDGMRYILERADAIARRKPGRSHLPVVINFSFGDVAGSHDGTLNLEAAIDELMRERTKTERIEVVIAAGNSHLGRLHAALSFTKARRAVALHWRVLPDDRTPSFLEIWLPKNDRNPRGRTSRIKLSVTSPEGLRSDPLDETSDGAGRQLLSDHGHVVCEARYRFIGPQTERGMFLIALQPTARNRPARPGDDVSPAAPSGTWTVTLENRSLKPDDRVEAWIQRDDTPYGFRDRGQQSYFDEVCYQRFDRSGRVIEDDDPDDDCIIKRAGSMNAVATGVETFVVGGYIRQSSKLARYSAGGPTLVPGEPQRWPRRGPNAIAVSDESRVLPGVLAAGTRSGSVVALNGTSVAAPQAARKKAAELGGLDPAGTMVSGPLPGTDVERTGYERFAGPGGRRHRR